MCVGSGKVQPLAEELLAIDGCWHSKSQGPQECVPGKAMHAAGGGPILRPRQQHQADSVGLKTKLLKLGGKSGGGVGRMDWGGFD